MFIRVNAARPFQELFDTYRPDLVFPLILWPLIYTYSAEA